MISSEGSNENSGLKFFGKINASISHEIRNGLAVMNENAGLIKDLLFMSEKGHPLDLGRVSERVKKILEQVKKTNSIVDNMNRFAHSVDNDVLRISAGECMEFVIRLSERFAGMKGVDIIFNAPEERVDITAFPFLLENLLFLCIEYAINNASEEKKIVISVEKQRDTVRFRFSGIKGDRPEGKFSDFEGIPEKLGAGITDEDIPGSLILDMPEEYKA